MSTYPALTRTPLPRASDGTLDGARDGLAAALDRARAELMSRYPVTYRRALAVLSARDDTPGDVRAGQLPPPDLGEMRAFGFAGVSWDRANDPGWCGDPRAGPGP